MFVPPAPEEVWRSEALCHPANIPRWLPPQAFFATGKRRVKVDGIRLDGELLVAAARAVCSVCPSQYECFVHAVTEREEDGIWGGALFSTVRAWQARPFDELMNMVAVAMFWAKPIQDAAEEALICESFTQSVSVTTISVRVVSRSPSRSRSPRKGRQPTSVTPPALASSI